MSFLDYVTLDEIAEAKLMNRIDTKYIANISCVQELLNLVNEDYKILQINERRILPYSTRYFDTFDLEMYNEHQRGRKTRQKIRIRKYEGDKELSFVEIKKKNNKGRTKKKRVELEEGKSLIDYHEFIREISNYDVEDLIPQIENHFYRITLVRKDMSERVTIDTQLEFHNLQTGLFASLPQIAIIEWKRKVLSEYSPMNFFLKKLRIKESGFSKYCIGMAKTSPTLKQNRFKIKIRNVDKLSA